MGPERARPLAEEHTMPKPHTTPRPGWEMTEPRGRTHVFF